MVDQLVMPVEDAYEFVAPDISELITENDDPVDNFASAKEQRLLVACLYSALKDQTFLAEANVGIFHTGGEPVIVPDVFLSFDVQVPEDWWEKNNRCYMVWKLGKPPDLVLEIVSNQVGKELGEKLLIYQKMRVSYYVVYDPSHQLGEQILRIYELRGRHYVEMQETWLEQVGLGLTLWQGSFEEREDTWLRWCDRNGLLLLTGDEKADQESQRADQESQRADQESQRADQESQRANQLAAKLRELGFDPETL
jgi:Uma2 family endonuclease